MELFTSAFKPAMIATKKLQEEQCIMGDFYKTWAECEIWLSEMEENIYASQLVSAMKNRKSKFLENDVYISAMF